MAPQSAQVANLQDSSITTKSAVTFPPFLNDSNLIPNSTIQTKPFEPIYIAGLVCLALFGTLCVGGFVVLLTGGKKGLWKKLRPRVRESDNERGQDEEGSRWRELHHTIDEEKGQAGDYTMHSVSLPTSHYRTRLNPILEESEDASTRSDRAYSTGIVTRPSESLTSLSSLSSTASLKTEEDISEADIQGQVFSRRLRKWDETNSLDSEATFLPSIASDTLRRGSELIEDERGMSVFEVKMAKAQNIEMTKARLVLLGLPLSEFRNEETVLSVESASSSDGGCDSVSSIECPSMEMSSGA
jgi:hypothetical protein